MTPYSHGLVAFQRALQRKFAVAGHTELALRVRPYQPFVAGSEAAKLRAKLVLEEAAELAQALESEDLEQVTKEAADLLYVLLAVCVVYNVPLSPAFWRVHENNMAKIDGGSVREDGKLVKPADHPKVRLADLLARRHGAGVDHDAS